LIIILITHFFDFKRFSKLKQEKFCVKITMHA